MNFDFKECSFNDADNNKKDQKGDSREGSGRAAIFKMTGIPLCYTMEGNYAVGLRINTLQPRFSYVENKRLLKEDNPVQDTSSAFYKKRKLPLFDRSVFEDVGRSLLVSLLDISCLNPESRLIKSKDEDVVESLEKLRVEIKRSLGKTSI